MIDAVLPRTKLSQQLEPQATKAEQDLASMVIVLRTFLGNRTTSTGARWCDLGRINLLCRVLKDRGWVRFELNADLGRASQGTLFEATEIAPAASGSQGPDKAPVAMNGAADAAAKTARELLERLNKGKPAA